MARQNVLQSNFTRGELSPRLTARTDLAAYFAGAATLENMIVLRQGGAFRRSGTRFVAEVKDSTRKVQLVPFQFSTAQGYVLEFGHQYVRFYTAEGRLESSPGVPLEIASTYQEAELPALRWTQSADVMYVVHPAHPPRRLSRLAHTNWTLTDVKFNPPPVSENGHKPAGTLTPGATTGTGITFTASVATFLAADIDRNIVAAQGRAQIKTVVSGTSITCDVLEPFASTDPIATGLWTVLGSPLALCTPTNKKRQVGQVINLTLSLAGWRSGDVGKFVRINEGAVRITVFVSTTVVNAEVVSVLANTTPAGEGTWTLNDAAWTAALGFPGFVSIFEERLFFTRGQRVWGSSTGDFENFNPGSKDADSIAFTLATDQVNEILWLVPSSILEVGTAGGEFTLASSDPNGGALTPLNVQVRRRTTHGGARPIPRLIQGAVLFLQRSGRKIRELIYQVETDDYQAGDLTILSEHVTKSGIVWLDYAQEPDSVLWCVRADGQLAALTYEKAEGVIGWHRHLIAGGTVENLAVILSPDESHDQPWLVVKRTIAGVTRRHVEFMEDQFTAETALADAFFVDAGLSYAGPPVTTLSGLGHLEGKTVAILADGATHPDKVVTAGAITLDRPTTRAHVGLGYTSTLKSMPFEAGTALGSAQGRPKAVHALTIRFLNTLGASFGAALDRLDVIPFRTSADPMGQPPALFSGDKRVVFPNGYEVDPRVMVVQDLPLPMTVLAVVAQLATSES